MKDKVTLGTWSRRAFLCLPISAVTPVAIAFDAINVDNLLTFDSLYKSVGVLGMVYSDQAKSLKGKEVRMRGYMAPPLNLDSSVDRLLSSLNRYVH